MCNNNLESSNRLAESYFIYGVSQIISGLFFFIIIYSYLPNEYKISIDNIIISIRTIILFTIIGGIISSVIGKQMMKIPILKYNQETEIEPITTNSNELTQNNKMNYYEDSSIMWTELRYSKEAKHIYKHLLKIKLSLLISNGLVGASVLSLIFITIIYIKNSLCNDTTCNMNTESFSYKDIILTCICIICAFLYIAKKFAILLIKEIYINYKYFYDNIR